MRRTVAIGLLVLLLAGGSGVGIGVPEPACRPQPIMACCAAGMAGMARECCTHKTASAAANGGQAQANLRCNCEAHTPVGSPARSDDSYTFASASPIPTVALSGHSVPSPLFFHPQGSIQPATPPPRA